MVKRLLLAVMLAVFVPHVASAKTDEEKIAEIAQTALQVVERYKEVRDENALKEAYDTIARNWPEFLNQFGEDHRMAEQYSLIYARAATAARDRKQAVAAWRYAVRLVGPDKTSHYRLNLNIEAAQAAAAVGDYTTAQQFFAAARAYAFTRGNNTEQARLFMRLQELADVGGAMGWRNLKDALYDMQKFAATFPMWSLPRLEAVVAEAELRVRFQPESREKRLDLSRLQAEVDLMAEGMGDAVPGAYVSRIRALNYALEDGYNL
jgi:hypothetical protein